MTLVYDDFENVSGTNVFIQSMGRENELRWEFRCACWALIWTLSAIRFFLLTFPKSSFWILKRYIEFFWIFKRWKYCPTLRLLDPTKISFDFAPDKNSSDSVHTIDLNSHTRASSQSIYSRRTDGNFRICTRCHEWVASPAWGAQRCTAIKPLDT